MRLLNFAACIKVLGKSKKTIEVQKFMSSNDYCFLEESFSIGNESYFCDKDNGISLTFKDSILSSIHLRFSGEDGYQVFNKRVADSNHGHYISIEAVKDEFGMPSLCGGGQKGFMGKVDPYWIRYDYIDYIMHFTLSFDQKYITLITLMVET